MRLYIHCDKKRFWNTLFLFYLIAAFLCPSVHSHDLDHDDGKVHHPPTLKLTASHNHVEHHAGERHSTNYFAPDVIFNDSSSHDHNSNNNQHYHRLENLSLRSNTGVGSLEGHKTFFLRAVSSSLAFNNLSFKTPNQLSPVAPPSNSKFIYVATDLPPPIA